MVNPGSPMGYDADVAEAKVNQHGDCAMADDNRLLLLGECEISGPIAGGWCSSNEPVHQGPTQPQKQESHLTVTSTIPSR